MNSVPYALYAATSGTPGVTGPTGLTGAVGATGPQGIQGLVGPMGATGLTGAVGATGPQGIQGIVGPTGSDGAIGPQGIQGLVGSTGATGIAGPAGAVGPTGAVGPAGTVGPVGPAGAAGTVGPAGPTGAVGPAGAAGTVGPAGPTGAVGPAGAAGTVGPAGPAGTVGATGATGPTGPVGVTGTTNYISKFTSATTLANSLIQDNGTSVSVNYPLQTNSQLFVYRQQLTSTGDGQSTIYGYRDRNSQNVGTSYAQNGSNVGIAGMSFWGDDYSFGVGGWNYNDFSRTGGVVGGEIYGNYWGSLGYKAASTITYGVYGSNAYASGSGYAPNERIPVSVGGGFFGMVGSVTKGDVIGQINDGELFSAYNVGDVYTSGKQVELINSGEDMLPSYSMTSPDAVVYKQGKGHLVDGRATIKFDSKYAQMLGESPIVTISPMGKCNGVYIVSVDKEGFIVEELNNGKSNVDIGWIAVGDRVDAKATEVPEFLKKSSFNTSLKKVMQSDGNTSQNAEGMSWDGKTLHLNLEGVVQKPVIRPTETTPGNDKNVGTGTETTPGVGPSPTSRRDNIIK
jgi:hypothetical protein